MAEEQDDVSGQAPEANDDLRSIIEAAVEEQKSETPDQEQAKPPAREAKLGTPPQGERARDPSTGRFVEHEKAEERREPKPRGPLGLKPAGEGAAPEPRPQDGAGLRPPENWSPTNKAQWTRLPMQIREAIASRENQIQTAEQRHAALAGVERFAEAARRSGTTLERALEAYTGIEDLLRRDPAGALVELLRNTPVQAATVLREVVRRMSGGQAPPGQQFQPQAQAHGADMPPLDPRVAAFMQRAEQREQMQARSYADSHVRDFWADPKHPYAENVASTMAGLIHQAHANGEPTPPLEQVYETACWMNPEVRALLIEETRQPGQGRQREIVRQARSQAKATTGAPANGAEYRDRAPESASLRDTIQWAIDAQR